jgi:hypothetical protein
VSIGVALMLQQCLIECDIALCSSSHIVTHKAQLKDLSFSILRELKNGTI